MKKTGEHNPEAVAQMAELDEARPDSQPDARGQQEEKQERPDIVGRFINPLGEIVQESFHRQLLMR